MSRPYNMTTSSAVGSSSPTKCRSQEERSERIRYLRAKAEETRLELLALEQEELDLIPPVQTTTPSEGTNSDQHKGYASIQSGHLYPVHHCTRLVMGDMRKTSRSGAADGSTGLGMAASPLSPLSSLSPPISPLATVCWTADTLTSPLRSSTATRVQSRQTERSPAKVTSVRIANQSTILSPDDVEDVLNSHLRGFHEDLMDVTISEMMNQHLMMLTESDDGDSTDNADETLNSQGATNQQLADYFQAPATPNDLDIQKDGEEQERDDHDGDDIYHESHDPANMTIANQTCIFMSNLEHQFAQQTISPGVPLLLEETIPKCDFADMTFMDFGNLTEPYEDANLDPMEHQPVPKQPENRGRSHRFENQSILSPLEIQQESILDEFLKLLPPLPSSPELKAVNQAPPPPPSTPARVPGSSSGRVLPAPIITSRERCQQILEMRNKRIQKFTEYRHNKSMDSISTLQTSDSDASASQNSVFSTPLTSNLPLSSSKSHDLQSTYGSPSEGLSAVASSTASSASQLLVSSNIYQESPKSISALLQKHRRLQLKQEPPHSRQHHVATSEFQKGDAGQRPLDMIIVRPFQHQSLGHAFNNGLHEKYDSIPNSPWTPVSSSSTSPSSSSSSSMSSSVTSSSSGSSWSWSLPFSSTTNDGKEEYIDTMMVPPKPRLPKTASKTAPTTGVDIRSRSMSSLMKHKNGWLGFQALDIRLVASGRHHIVVVTKNNQVYSCWEESESDNGNNSSKRNEDDDDDFVDIVEKTLGRATRTQNDSGFVQDTTHQPGLVEFLSSSSSDGKPIVLSTINKVVCSDHATFVLTENGELWGWGFFQDSQGKRYRLLKDKDSIRAILICPHKIVSVSCGANHVLVLNTDGDVISWGSNRFGQLGRGVSNVEPCDLLPYFIESLPPRITGIGCGKKFSFAWDDERLYGWGDNSFGQLGAATSFQTRKMNQSTETKVSENNNTTTTTTTIQVTTPKEILLHWKGKSIKQVQGGDRHTVILTFSGLVIAMGNDTFGQLGCSSSGTSNSTTSLCSKSTSHRDENYKNDTTSTAASRSSSNSSSTWSKIDLQASASTTSTTTRQKSAANTKTRLYPALVRIGPAVKEISCGDFHTATYSDNGYMCTWGKGYDGVVVIHNADPTTTSMFPFNPHQSAGAQTSAPSYISAQEQARKVVAISAMRDGASVALVQ
ncbi:hypothetical protein BG004_003894 [Podila humilis]|nr:hypothetical protein BG004_003894 [Podila humilis]